MIASEAVKKKSSFQIEGLLETDMKQNGEGFRIEGLLEIRVEIAAEPRYARKLAKFRLGTRQKDF